MFGSNVVEVGIGLVLMYFLLSLICSTITELISRAVDMRAKTLAEGIRGLLTSAKAEDFYNHPLIARLSSRKRSEAAKGRLLKQQELTKSQALPYYISPKDFSLVLLDLLAPAAPGGTPKTIDDIKKSIANLPEGDLKRSLSALVNEAEGDLTKLREGIERWFNGTMECVQGWYRRKAQWITMGIAVIVAVCANADTLTTANMLTRDAAFRNTVVAAATNIVEEQPALSAGETVTSTQKIRDLQNSLSSLGYPIGWVSRTRKASDGSPQPADDPRMLPGTPLGWANKLLGLALTALLVSLGAPFWFDMLNKLVNLRATGKPQPITTEPEAPGVDELTRQVAALKRSLAMPGLNAPSAAEPPKPGAAGAMTVSESQPAKG